MFSLIEPFGGVFTAPVASVGGGAAAFSPTDVAGMQWWFAATGTLWQDSGRTTPVTANDDPVGAMDDKSANGYHATQSTANARPLYKTGTQNGLAGVLADGSNDKLLTASITHGIGTGEFYLILAVKIGASITTYDALWGNGDFAPALYVRTIASDKLSAYFGGDKTFDTVLSTNTTYLLEFWREAGVLKAAVNAVQEATTHAVATSVPNSTTCLFDEAPSSTNTPIASFLEGLFFNVLPSAAERTSLRSYLNGIWAIY